jgi:MFS family permease
VTTKRLIPMLIIGVMGNNVITLTPMLLGAMVSDRGFTERQAGYIAAADLAGFTLATFCTAFIIDRYSWRKMAIAGVALMLFANVLVTTIHGSTAFALIRFVSGMGGGLLVAIATVSLGRDDTPDRNYGLLYAAGLLVSMVGFWVLPPLLARFGLNSAYWLIALLGVVAAIAAVGQPHGHPAYVTKTAVASGERRFLTMGVLLSIVLFFTEQNAMWAFAERIGDGAGLSGQYVGFSLGMSALSAAAGAGLIAWLGTSFGRIVPLIVLTILQLACLAGLAGHVSGWMYLTSIMLITFVWNAAIPLQLGTLAEIDPNGRALALSATVTALGLTLGPAIAGLVVGNERNYSTINWVSAILAVFTLVLLIPAVLAIQRRPAAA